MEVLHCNKRKKLWICWTEWKFFVVNGDNMPNITTAADTVLSGMVVM